jgi:hypothetical protein
MADEQGEADGPEGTDALAASSVAAGWLADAGRWDEASAILWDVALDEERIFGPDAAYRAGTLQDLATALVSAERFGDAVDVYGVLLAVQSGVLDAGDPEIFDARLQLGKNLALDGRVDDAIGVITQLHRDVEPYYPPDGEVNVLLVAMLRELEDLRQGPPKKRRRR